MAIDVFLLHFSPMLNQFLPTRKVLQKIFLNEGIHQRLGEILEKLCLDGAGAGSPALQEQRVDVKEERKVELKYVDKIFELLGHLVQAASLSTKVEFSVVVEASLVKIVRGGIERKDLSESTIAGKATRRFLKLIAQLTFGMHTSDLNQMTLFQRRAGDHGPGGESQVMKCLVDILRLYAHSLEGQADPTASTQATEQQQAQNSSQLTLIYDTLKLLSNLCSYSSDLCKQASSAGIHEVLDPLTRHILNLSPPLSLTKSLKLLTHLLSLFRNVHANEDALSKSNILLQPSLFAQLLKFAYSHLFQILGKGNNQNISNLNGNQKVLEKLNLLHQICDNSCYLGLQFGKNPGAQIQNEEWS